MKFGVCTSPRALVEGDVNLNTAIQKLSAFAREADIDFVEFAVSCVQAEGEQSEWQVLQKAVQRYKLPVPSFNCFIPAHHRLTGPDVQLNRVLDYARVVLQRCHELGGEVVVLGSGGARRIPEGFSHQEARRQFVAFCRALGPIAAETQMTVAIEPLNRREDNLINSVEAGAALVDEIAHSSIQLLADSYHMDEEAESYEQAAKAGRRLRHAHIADLGRKAPGFSVSGEAPFTDFFRALRSAGYASRTDARVAIECSWEDFAAQVAPSIALLRQRWEESA
jgi:sugar phosphate isomerase/epimerase